VCAEATSLLVRGFLLVHFQLQPRAFANGGSYEEWIKEARLDFRTGSRAQDASAKESSREKIAKQLKRSEGATRQKAFSIGLSLDTRA